MSFVENSKYVKGKEKKAPNSSHRYILGFHRVACEMQIKRALFYLVILDELLSVETLMTAGAPLGMEGTG